MTTTPDLLAAISATMRSVGYVQKQRGDKLNYTYAGEAALLAALRPVMVEHGLTMAPVGVQSETRKHGETRNGAMQWRVDGVWTFRLLHTSGGYLDVQAPGSGVDTGDKAAYKAATGALKYALRQTFLIETGDDPDPYPSAHQEAMPTLSAAAFRTEMADAFAQLDVTNAEMDAFCTAHKMPTVPEMSGELRDKLLQRLLSNHGEPLASWLASQRSDA